MQTEAELQVLQFDEQASQFLVAEFATKAPEQVLLHALEARK